LLASARSVRIEERYAKDAAKELVNNYASKAVRARSLQAPVGQCGLQRENGAGHIESGPRALASDFAPDSIAAALIGFTRS